MDDTADVVSTLSSAPLDDRGSILPARMLNELVYCERLYALEHVQGEWADSADTVDGQTVHRRVDQPSREGLPEPTDDPDRPRSVRSVELSDRTLGIIAKIDLVEVEADRVVPVDYKRGSAPDVEHGAYPPERVQVAAQVLLLRAHGYRVDHGILYFAASKTRVRVDVDDRLANLTLHARDRARQIMRESRLPPPLIDSPKCRGCSLVGICLPDETNLLRGESDRVRPLMPARDDGVPLYVQAMGGSIGKSHEEIVVKDKGVEIGRARFSDTNRVVVLGNVSVTSPLLQALAERDVPLAVHGGHGWLHGLFLPASGHNVITRMAQHRVAADREGALRLAKAMVAAKIKNSRVLLRRNAEEMPDSGLMILQDAYEQTQFAPDIPTLMGIEGSAARVYFEHLPRMLKSELRDKFRMDGRNRRPPRDPINALLSFAYAMLVRECTLAAHNVGLDAWVGFLHQPRPGRPALALDLMEEFRPIIADSTVITAINTGVVDESSFLIRPTGCTLTDSGRRAFLRVIERRFDELITHPTFGTRLSYRRVLEVQARLLGKALLGEIPAYPGFVVR